MPDSQPAPPQAPSLWALFTAFSGVGLSGFGGVLPFVRRMLVDEKRWMSPETFNAQLGLCQFLPGPNVVNLAVLVGKRQRGLAGAFLAPLGLLSGPFLLILILGGLYDHYGHFPETQRLLRGVAATGVGLLLAMAWKMGQAMRYKILTLPVACMTVLAIAFWRYPMPWVMAVGLCVSAGLVYRLLGREEQKCS
jgi:chromate transporter